MNFDSLLRSGKIRGWEAGQLLVQNMVEWYRSADSGEGDGLLNDIQLEWLRNQLKSDADVRQFNRYAAACRFFQHFTTIHHLISARLDTLLVSLWHELSRLHEAENEYRRMVNSPRIMSKTQFARLREEGIDEDDYPGGIAVLRSAYLPVSDGETTSYVLDDAGDYHPAQQPAWASHLAEPFLANVAPQLPTIYQEISQHLQNLHFRRDVTKLVIEYVSLSGLDAMLPNAYNPPLLQNVNTLTVTLPSIITRHNLFPTESSPKRLRHRLLSTLQTIPTDFPPPSPSAIINVQLQLENLLLTDDYGKMMEGLKG